MDNGDVSRREALSEAFDKLAGDTPTETTTTTTTEAPEPVETTSAAPAESTSDTDTTETAEQKAQRARDEKGRFAKSEKTDATAKPVEGKTTATPPPATVETTHTEAPKWKPPQAWRPLAREKWAALPPEVQEEIARREGEVPKALEQAASARKFHDEFQRTVAPFEGMIRAEGGDPIRAVGSLLQTAAALRTAPPAHKAQLVAQIVRQFGIDVGMLDQALAGQPLPAQAHQPPPVDPRTVVREEFQRLRAEAVQTSAAREVEKFAAANEFASDKRVRNMMAAIIESDAGEGIETTFADAYARACQALPDIAQVLKQREAAKAAATAQAATQRAKDAAASVKGQPAAVGPAQPKSRREALEQAYAQQAAR